MNNQTVKKVQYLQPAKLKAPLTKTNPHRLKLTVQNLRQENRELQMKIEQYISKSSVPLSEDIHSDFLNIFTSNLNKNNVPPFMKLFWQEQQKYVQASRNGVCYHPMLIRFCLNLVSKSPSAYEELRYNEKDGTGFLILPSQRRLRDFQNYIKPQRGFNKEIINELVEKTKNFTSPERNIVLTFDEMKIQYGLVWDKHSGDLIDYVDLGDVEVNYATLENTEEIASHVIINPFKFSLANFATTNVTAVQLFSLFWKAVGILERKCFLCVIDATCDGASSNRKYLIEMYHISFRIISTVV